MATIIRAVCNERRRKRIAPITLTGRMPLTNYLLQTLIAATLFYHWGFGVWDKVGPALDLGLAVAIFCVIQLPLSRWWLRRLQIGPLEYLWRVLTYGRNAVVPRRRLACPARTRMIVSKRLRQVDRRYGSAGTHVAERRARGEGCARKPLPHAERRAFAIAGGHQEPSKWLLSLALSGSSYAVHSR